jgi:hypothetical protein
MKKLFAIAVVMGTLFFVSVSAKAQYPSSRNMERRDQSNQYNSYDDDQYNWDNDNGQYNQRNVRVNSNRPKVTIVIGANGRRGYNRYNDYRRYNDHRRYHRYNRYDRYDRYRHHRPYYRNW